MASALQSGQIASYLSGTGGPDLSALRFSSVSRDAEIAVGVMGFFTPSLAGKGGIITDIAQSSRRNIMRAHRTEYTSGAKIHGNSKNSPKTAYLYELYQQDGTFLKYGITQNQNVAKRYTKSFMEDKLIDRVAGGKRVDMLALERQLVTENPGPLNLEKWAKEARAAGRGQ